MDWWGHILGRMARELWRAALCRLEHSARVDQLADTVQWLYEQFGEYPVEIGLPEPPLDVWNVPERPAVPKFFDPSAPMVADAVRIHTIRLCTYMVEYRAWACRLNGRTAWHEFFPRPPRGGAFNAMMERGRYSL